MTTNDKLGLGVIGCGHIATQRVAQWESAGKVEIIVGLDPSTPHFERFSGSLAAGPARAESIDTLLAKFREQLDAVYIATPHNCHAFQAEAALRAGLDVLVEKPMAYSLADARAIEAAARDTDRVLIVAFNGSLSPKLRATSDAVRAGKFGRLLAISGHVSENWAGTYAGHWKQEPGISGGGFLLDSGSHALNAIVDLAGCGVESVSAVLSEVKPGVEVTASLSGRMRNGALLALCACGDTAPPCLGEVTMFCERAVVTVDPWGKRPSTVRRDACSPVEEVPYGEERELIDLFTDVRSGRIENPSPISRNVEFARLWAATRESASHAGRPVHVDEMGG